MSARILIAGIGNIFHGDDAFGVAMARRFSAMKLPEGVSVVDFGIRSYDLAYAIMDGYDAVILVDATSRGQAPGTIYLLEPDLDAGEFAASDADAHNLKVESVLQMVRSLGGKPCKILLVGCEPAVLERENGEIGLSPGVEAAIPGAVELIQSLVDDLIREHEKLVRSKGRNEELVPCASQQK